MRQMPCQIGESGLSRPDSDLPEGHLLGEQSTGTEAQGQAVTARVRIGAPDASLTGLAGLVAVDELSEGWAWWPSSTTGSDRSSSVLEG